MSHSLLQNLPIGRKLVVATMLVTGTALVLTCLGFVLFDISKLRQYFVRFLQIQSEMVASNSVSAVLFEDSESANATLASLRADPQITFAQIVRKGGRTLATYRRSDLAESEYLPDLSALPSDGFQFSQDRFSISRRILSEGEPIGTLYIQADAREMYARMKGYGWIALIILVTACAVALWVSMRVQRVVSQPILELTEAARTISREKNYSIVVPADRDDELGVLGKTFNEMLRQILTDMEARSRAEEALRRNEERLNLALRSAGMGTWSWEIETDHITSDEYLGPLYGLAPGQFPQNFEGFARLLHREDRDRVEQEVARSVEHDVEYNTEYAVIFPDGRFRWIAARGKTHRDESNRPVRMTGICWDVNDRKQAEEEIRKLNAELEGRVEQRTAELVATNKELEAFTYSVSHDLRAPLRHVDGFARILVEDYGSQLDPEARRYLQRVQDGTRQMGQLVDDLLDLTRLGRQELRRQATGVNSMVNEVMAQLQQDFEGRQIEWKIDRLPFVDCDPALMKQVFSNLLSNAVKFTRLREKAVIEVGTADLNGQPVVFVRDNGVGFSMKYADKLFGVFQRLHRQEDFEGTGVGLATVQRIIHKHGGKIWAEAELDKGATFYFTLSIAAESQSTIEETIGGKS
ncbi:MAG TPA: ATP-binding protein [Acidobacteriota bacterium]|jgi:signal transduction histidine kinase/HAMP domain-containing protein